MSNLTKDELAVELTKLINNQKKGTDITSSYLEYKADLKSLKDFIFSSDLIANYKEQRFKDGNGFLVMLNDFQELARMVENGDTKLIIVNRTLKDTFFEIVNQYLVLVADVDKVMYARNHTKISYHILAMRILNTIKGLDKKPRSIVINKSRVFLEKDISTLFLLITLLSHGIFKIQTSPLIVNKSNFEDNDIEEVFISCSEVISILTIIWYHYFSTEFTANKFIEDIKINKL